MRAATFACLAATLTAGCTDAGEAEPTPGAGLTTIDCSLNGAGGFGHDCSMERVTQDGDSFVIVRHPDGAFRRFQLAVPGQGLITAAGAEQAEVTDMGGYVEVRVGSDRYHMPVAE